MSIKSQIVERRLGATGTSARPPSTVGFSTSRGGTNRRLKSSRRSSDEILSRRKPGLPRVRLGRFAVNELVGCGGMGSVYRAIDKRTRQVVAIKRIGLQRVICAETIERFQREIAVVELLGRHPHVVAARGAGDLNGEPFLVMEHLPGPDLGQVVARAGRLSLAAACEVTRQAALGIAHVHRHRVIHRDVKPSNLMLASGGIVKVVDFGLARPQGTRAAANGPVYGWDEYTVGTADYMAPEQVQSPTQVDERADIYALGCTLYFLLTGHTPQRNRTLGRTVCRRIARPAPRPISARCPNIPSSFAKLMKQLLAREPERRVPTAQAVVDRLTPFSSGADIEALMDTRPPDGATSRRFQESKETLTFVSAKRDQSEYAFVVSAPPPATAGPRRPRTDDSMSSRPDACVRCSHLCL